MEPVRICAYLPMFRRRAMWFVKKWSKLGNDPCRRATRPDHSSRDDQASRLAQLIGHFG